MPLNAVVVEREAFVIDTQQMQDRRVHVVCGDRIFYRGIANGVGCTESKYEFETSANQDVCESFRVMIASLVQLSRTGLSIRRAAEFCRDHHDSRIQ